MTYVLSPGAQSIYDNPISNYNPIPTKDINSNVAFGTLPVISNLQPAFLCAKVTATESEILATPNILQTRIDSLKDKMLKVFDYCCSNQSLQLGVISQIQVQPLTSFDLSQSAAVYLFALSTNDYTVLNAMFGGLSLFQQQGNIGDIAPWNALVI